MLYETTLVKGSGNIYELTVPRCPYPQFYFGGRKREEITMGPLAA